MFISHRHLGIFEKFRENNKDIKNIGKIIGLSDFCIIRQIIMTNDRKLVGKLIEKKKEQKSEEGKYDLNLRGENLINIEKIISSEIKGKNYYLILMEEAILRDLGK
jgi:hypothetical protein